MSTTLEELEAQSKVVEVLGDVPLVAATLEALGAYEQVDHCRIHAGVARDTIAACEALLKALS
jgi:hypothetical protein